MLLKKADEWEVIDTMPCTIKVLPVVRREASFHDFEEYERLIEAARLKGWRTHLIVLLGGDAGLRAGEMVALHWADVDFSRRRLRDWEALGLARKASPTPKNGRVRYVPLTERLFEALREYRHLRRPRVICKGRWTTAEPSVGVDARLASGAARWCANGHTHPASHVLLAAGDAGCARPEAIQELAGHQELSGTQGYMHLSPDMLPGRRFGCWTRVRGRTNVETSWRRPPLKIEVESTGISAEAEGWRPSYVFSFARCPWTSEVCAADCGEVNAGASTGRAGMRHYSFARRRTSGPQM